MANQGTSVVVGWRERTGTLRLPRLPVGAGFFASTSPSAFRPRPGARTCSSLKHYLVSLCHLVVISSLHSHVSGANCLALHQPQTLDYRSRYGVRGDSAKRSGPRELKKRPPQPTSIAHGLRSSGPQTFSISLLSAAIGAPYPTDCMRIVMMYSLTCWGEV